MFGLDLGPALASEGASGQRIADRLASEIRRQQPRGPYHLLGWSLGGALALAIAHALEQQEEAVAFLGILDTQPATSLYGAGTPDVVAELAEYVHPTARAELLALPAAELRALRERLVQGLDGDERGDGSGGLGPDPRLPARAPCRPPRSRTATRPAGRGPVHERAAAAVPPRGHSRVVERRDRSSATAARPWTGSGTRAAVHTATAPGDHLAALEERRARAPARPSRVRRPERTLVGTRIDLNTERA